MDLRTGDPYLLSFLSAFTSSKVNTVNVYKHLRNPGEILERWKQCGLEPTDTILNGRYRLHEVFDADFGIRETISKNELTQLTKTHPELLKAIVYLRYQHGNLFAFLAQEETPEQILLTNKTSVVEDLRLELFHHAKIGDYIPTNQIWHGKDYDGIETTLEYTLKSKSFVCYTVAAYDTIRLMDYPD